MKLGRVSGCKISGAIVQEHGHRLVPRSRNQDQVKSAVAIYVAREQHQPAGRGRDAYRLQPALGQLKGDPIARMVRVETRDLHGGEIWPAIPVEIADCKLRVSKSKGRILSLNPASRSAVIGPAGQSYVRK